MSSGEGGRLTGIEAFRDGYKKGDLCPELIGDAVADPGPLLAGVSSPPYVGDLTGAKRSNLGSGGLDVLPDLIAGCIRMGSISAGSSTI